MWALASALALSDCFSNIAGYGASPSSPVAYTIGIHGVEFLTTPGTIAKYCALRME